MVNGEVKARDISKYLSGTKACFSTIDTKSRGLRNVIVSFLILDGIRNRLTKQSRDYWYTDFSTDFEEAYEMLKEYRKSKPTRKPKESVKTDA